RHRIRALLVWLWKMTENLWYTLSQTSKDWIYEQLDLEDIDMWRYEIVQSHEKSIGVKELRNPKLYLTFVSLILERMQNPKSDSGPTRPVPILIRCAVISRPALQSRDRSCVVRWLVTRSASTPAFSE